MINHDSKKKEHLQPKDSEQKKIKSPDNDENAVLKSKDQSYKKKKPTSKDPARTRENSEQPVNPVKDPPKED